MNDGLVEQADRCAADRRQKEFSSNVESSVEVSVQELSRAVGRHALLQVEIDRKIALHIVEMREELRLAKSELQSLRAQMDQLIHSLAQALESTLRQQVRAPQASAADRYSPNTRSK
jgi:LPS O-antigen subunit length determinant protein (WzzB/FepE family)